MIDWLLFGALMLVHLLYDFHWQGDFIGLGKSKYFFLLLVHCLTWTLCLSAILWLFAKVTLFSFVFLLITHLLIDFWKCRLAPEKTKLTTALWIDQSLHLISIIMVCIF